MDGVVFSILQNGPQVESVGRLFGRGFLWLLVSAVYAVLPPFIYALVIGVHNGFYAGLNKSLGGNAIPFSQWTFDAFAAGLMAGFGLTVAMLVAALLRGRIVGHGRLRDGLALNHIQRHALLIFLCFATMTVPVCGGLTVAAQARNTIDYNGLNYFRQILGGSAFYNISMVFLMIVLAPIAEELFFRGWLWSGLRRHWRPFPVFFATAIPFLLIHLPGGIASVFALIPATIAISLARHYCGGTRASMLVHSANNLSAVAVMLAIRSL